MIDQFWSHQTSKCFFKIDHLDHTSFVQVGIVYFLKFVLIFKFYQNIELVLTDSRTLEL